MKRAARHTGDWGGDPEAHFPVAGAGLMGSAVGNQGGGKEPDCVGRLFLRMRRQCQAGCDRACDRCVTEDVTGV